MSVATAALVSTLEMDDALAVAALCALADLCSEWHCHPRKPGALLPAESIHRRSSAVTRPGLIAAAEQLHRGAMLWILLAGCGFNGRGSALKCQQQWSLSCCRPY